MQFLVDDLTHFIQFAAVFFTQGSDVAVKHAAHLADLVVLLRLLSSHLGSQRTELLINGLTQSAVTDLLRMRCTFRTGVRYIKTCFLGAVQLMAFSQDLMSECLPLSSVFLTRDSHPAQFGHGVHHKTFVLIKPAPQSARLAMLPDHQNDRENQEQG